MEPLIRALGSTVYIDANIVIYAVEGFPAFQTVLHALLQCVDDEKLRLVTSELTLAEVLVKPIENRDSVIQQAYRDFLEPTSQVAVVPISRTILESAARTRAETGMKLPDAIHVATAKQHECTSFLTNDRLIRSMTDIPVMRINELSGLQG